MNQQSLKDSVETGQYFVEARTWYNNIFLFPIRHNAFLLGVSLSIVLVLIFVSYGLYNTFPLSQKVQIIVPLENTLQYSPKIKDISSPGRSNKEVVLEYLVQKYITARETYDPRTFKKNYYYVMRSTNKALFNNYYAKMSDNGPQGPSSLYKNGLRSKIEFISQVYDGNNNFITVNFAKQNYNLITGTSSLQQFTAKVQFAVSDYDFSESENARLSFIVTDYEITELKN